MYKINLSNMPPAFWALNKTQQAAIIDAEVKKIQAEEALAAEEAARRRRRDL